MDDGNNTTTRLLTLLNVSAVKNGKRKRVFEESSPIQKLNKRKSVLFADVSNDTDKGLSKDNEDIDKAVEQIQPVEGTKDIAEDVESNGALTDELS